eukprot:672720-Alexandrium_andersonii.AAC.1
MAGWAPAWTLPSLGVWFGVRGAPRAPRAVAAASAALAWLRTGGWGPEQLQMEAKRHWQAAVRQDGAGFRLATPRRGMD